MGVKRGRARRFAREVAATGPGRGREFRKFEESKPVAGAIFKDRLRVAGLVARRRGLWAHRGDALARPQGTAAAPA